MEAKPNDLKLGMFVLIAFGLLCGGLFAFGAVSYFQRTVLAETYVSGNVDGLSVGAPVTLQGVKVGKVTKIDFSWNVYSESEQRYVIIEFEVRRSIAPGAFGKGIAERIQKQVRCGLRARVNAQGFTGSSLLSLEYMNPAQYPAPAFPWEPKHLCIPSAPSQFAEVLTSLQQTLQKAAQLDFGSLAGSLQRDLDAAERLIVRLEGDLGSAEKLIGHLDEVNYKELATNADRLITQLRGDLSQMRLAKLSGDADALVVNMNGTIRNLDTASLNEALANIRLATQDLDETLRKLKQYPSGFPLGKPPAAVKIPEKAEK
ncbi:MAG: MlaD family protein [Limisphaerales bacterium]